MKTYLKYIMDPYCGWCYGNNNVLGELSKLYEIEIITAGMWSNYQSRTGQEIKDFAIPGSKIITQKTNQPFTEEYFKLLEDNILFDSEIPSRAINTIKEIEPVLACQFTNALQIAHFKEGIDLNLEQTYENLCKSSGIDVIEFKKEFNSEKQKHNTQTEFSRASQLARTYPTLIAVSELGDIELVEGKFNLEEFKTNIERIMSENNKLKSKN